MSMGEGADVGPEWCSRVVGVGDGRNGKGAGWMAIGWWVAVGGIYRGWEEGLSEWRGGIRGGKAVCESDTLTEKRYIIIIAHISRL